MNCARCNNPALVLFPGGYCGKCNTALSNPGAFLPDRKKIKSTKRGGWAHSNMCRECGKHKRVKPHPNCKRCMEETERVTGRASKVLDDFRKGGF